MKLDNFTTSADAMSTDAEIASRYDAELRPRIREIQSLWRLNQSLNAGMGFGLFAPLITISQVEGLSIPVKIGFGVVGAALALICFIKKSKLRESGRGEDAMERRFENEIVPEFFRLICPKGEYLKGEKMDRADFEEAGIFTPAMYQSISSDFLVRDQAGQTPFEAADVAAYSDRSEQGAGDDKYTETRTHIFRGLFFHFDFGKSGFDSSKYLRCEVIVQPRDTLSLWMGRREGLQEVRTGNAAFDRVFKVYASDPAVALQILTPEMMQHMLILGAQQGKHVFLSFRGKRAWLGIRNDWADSYGEPLFHLDHAPLKNLSPLAVFRWLKNRFQNRTGYSKKNLLDVAAQYRLGETIARELRQNPSAWLAKL